MFDSDLWNEIFKTISMRRRQSLMTAFGVFWGILMLTLLLGAGRGLDNGIVTKVKTLPPNELFIKPQETSLPYMGFGRDRMWLLNSQDEELIRNRYGSSLTSFNAINYSGYQNVVMGEQTFQCQVTGVGPQFDIVQPQRVTAGRFINDIDMREHRKVCVLGENVADMLFANHQEAIGKIIEVNGMSLTVVGVTHCTNRQVYVGIDLPESVLLPLPTQQAIYGRGDEIDYCTVVMDDSFPLDQHKDQIVAIIKQNHSIHPDDQLAVTATMMTEFTTKYNNLITGTHILIWIVGLGTLIAGLIGIANIMLVSVRERTQEIGIRRAIGARPGDIITQIILDSLVLTSAAGLAGLCSAVWILHIAGNMLPQGDDAVFAQLSIPFRMAVVAMVILIAGGLLAGLIPALRALSVKPIDALREE